MSVHQMDDEIDIGLFLKHFYKNRGLIFRVLLLAIVISIVYTMATFLFSPPVYNYTSQSVIDMTIAEEADYQKSMFISYLDSRKIFEESAKSINLTVDYKLWRDYIVIENIRDTNQIVFKISAANSEKLVELNRRMVSNAIFQSSGILLGLNVQTLEEAKLLDNVPVMRNYANLIKSLFTFSTIGLMGVFGLLTLQVISDRRIKRAKDIEGITDLSVIGTIPHFKNLALSEEINMRNFVKGLLWKQKK